MSTRCVVKVTNGYKSIELYHHHDGYPEGIGFFLLKEMEKVKDETNYEYMHSSLYLTKWIKEFSFEPTLANHSDIEYYYKFDTRSKKVKCQQVNNWEGEMEVIKEYDLEAYYEQNKENDCNLYY